MFKIINNKKVQMTQDEAALYDEIVKSYTTLTNKGEDLFIDLFEVDDNGIIVFLRPPSKRQTSFQVFLFMVNLVVHQHLRLMHEEVSSLNKELSLRVDGLEQKISKIEEKINE